MAKDMNALIGDVINKLAEYENTNLLPQKIAEIN